MNTSPPILNDKLLFVYEFSRPTVQYGYPCSPILIAKTITNVLRLVIAISSAKQFRNVTIAYVVHSDLPTDFDILSPTFMATEHRKRQYYLQY